MLYNNRSHSTFNPFFKKLCKYSKSLLSFILIVIVKINKRSIAMGKLSPVMYSINLNFLMFVAVMALVVPHLQIPSSNLNLD
jgi:hypothetical protein